MKTPRYWLARLETDRTFRRVVWFWGVFYGLGFVVQLAAFFVSTDGPIWEAVLFQIVVLTFVVFAVSVMVSVTLAVMRIFGSTTRSNEDAP